MPTLLCLHVAAKVLLELAEGSSVAVATKLFVDAGLASHLTGSEALTMLAPLDEAFRGASRSRTVQALAGERASELWTCLNRRWGDGARPQGAAEEPHCEGTAVLLDSVSRPGAGDAGWTQAASVRLQKRETAPLFLIT